MDQEKEEIGASSSVTFSFDEAGRGCRNTKKRTDPTCCPVCSLTLRPNEVETHLASEIDKLNKLPSNKHKFNGKNAPSSSMSNGHDRSVYASDRNWGTYQKVRNNRQTRQRQKSRKRRAEEVVCPICNKETSEDITLHVEMCLRRSEAEEESDENIDVEAFEEYEWAGQTRVRATSMLYGGVSSLGSTVTSTEEDEDLNVDGDDAQVYGQPQYFESDIILPAGDANDIALRKAIIGEGPRRLSSQENGVCDEIVESRIGDPVIEVLKNRIRELENREQNGQEVYKCLICMERYKTPVVSVCCWHVHCEQCWLQTLGAKKLCPQCNMITSPADLRKIYM